mmetsp:Transcript_67225/g.161083  ORF Transcript_67225/g.161083 Transcript_67225/m.161083 type:complete len:180 (+) Transcript_67225:84-623(+)|eukprot:CAMPEP_0178438224 /NCGR_PEP_ID=MMETSP0689_2-20121128/35471_1 /TAXON_ID=160604 /ORGANISM="Amphidinium massartii, Strain CS-259" /LENGTH=179 /DNA_ID=CAMNT_0020060597 /DNA_START=1 /DNA_END=540 /DNA_ORIENTATION=-
MTKVELPQLEPKKVNNLYSKTDLVKAISEFLNDALPRVGYEEDHWWSNIRILICLVCCSFGLYAQFGTKFPQDRLALGACVIGYFSFSAILAVVDYCVIKQSVMCLKLGGERVFVDICMPAFSPEVSLMLRSSDKKDSIKKSVDKYFDSDGYLRQEAVFSDFTSLTKSFEKIPKEKKTQ